MVDVYLRAVELATEAESLRTELAAKDAEVKRLRKSWYSAEATSAHLSAKLDQKDAEIERLRGALREIESLASKPVSKSSIALICARALRGGGG